MTVNIPAPFFREVSDNNCRIYQSTLTPDNSGKFLIRLSGSDRQSHHIKARFCTIDNTANSADITWINGLLSGVISGYNAKSFPLDLFNDSLQLSGVNGAINITLSNMNLQIPDLDNSYLSNLVRNTPVAFGGAASATLDTQTVTVGNLTTTEYGYSSAAHDNFGVIADGTSNIYGGAVITDLFYDTVRRQLYLIITGGNLTNSGWTNMVVNGTTFKRTDAIFSGEDGRFGIGFSQWIFETVTNPFSAVASNSVVTWT